VNKSSELETTEFSGKLEITSADVVDMIEVNVDRTVDIDVDIDVDGGVDVDICVDLGAEGVV
jgi:hypothetical protein